MLATAGADREIKLWIVDADANREISVTHSETLTGHARAVNCARWNTRGDMLASAGDGGEVLVWRRTEEASTSTNAHGDAVTWKPARTLRGHLDDALDVSWGPNETLASASVDNTTILWNVESGSGLVKLQEHSHYVQGVAFDPRGEYVVSQSPDRTARVYTLGERITSKSVKHAKMIKTLEDPSGCASMRDDSMTSFFRRPAWSLDGSFFVLPAGMFKRSSAERSLNTSLVFARHNFNVPAMHLPGGETPSVCVRFNPVLFVKRERQCEHVPTDLAYRIVFAICSQDSVTVYDTSESEPIVHVSGIHCTSITDASWHPDGHTLVVTSTDGFASVVAFRKGELGAVMLEADVPEDVRSLLPSVRARQKPPSSEMQCAPLVPRAETVKTKSRAGARSSCSHCTHTDVSKRGGRTTRF